MTPCKNCIIRGNCTEICDNFDKNIRSLDYDMSYLPSFILNDIRLKNYKNRLADLTHNIIDYDDGNIGFHLIDTSGDVLIYHYTVVVN